MQLPRESVLRGPRRLTAHRTYLSLDGYIAGPNDAPGNPGGDGFGRLHEWFVTPHGEQFRPPGPAGRPAASWLWLVG